MAGLKADQVSIDLDFTNAHRLSNGFAELRQFIFYYSPDQCYISLLRLIRPLISFLALTALIPVVSQFTDYYYVEAFRTKI